jgi:hypothetical protein
MEVHMVEIKLTQGKVAIIDDCDAHLAQFKWYAGDGRGGRFYASRHLRADEGRGKGIVMLHKEIIQWAYVDHTNGNTLDNRRSNLREASASENGRNRGRGPLNTSGYKGVYHHGGSSRNPWLAQIDVENSHKYLGIYPTAIEAARAYDFAALWLHGKFARFNFPEWVAALQPEET